MVKVLVVDDDPAIVLFLQVNLELAGHEVRTAADGRAALEAVGGQRPDVVILDVRMPKLDGWGVLERLKAHPDEAVRTIPVLVLTALDSERDRARAGIEGAVRFLTKPVVPEDLTEALHLVVDGPPEPAQRKDAQHRGLASLARIERDAAGGAPPIGPRTRLSGLELPRPPTRSPAVRAADETGTLDGELTAKQRELLHALLTAPSVSAAAADLGMSRSNVYASLRRVGRKLGVTDVTELLRLVRAGRVTALLEP